MILNRNKRFFPGSCCCLFNYWKSVFTYLNNADIVNQESHAIAVAVPIEGDAKDSGFEVLLGVAEAQNEFNKKIKSKQINQKPLKVIIASEEENNLNAIKSIAHSLVDYQNQEILGVIGHYTSDATEEAIKIYEESNLSDKRVVLISPTSTKTEIPNHGYFFRTVPNNQNMMLQMF